MTLIGFACLLLVGCLSQTHAADFEAPPAPYQTGPRPADGETVSANPPCFVYPSDRSYESYLIEVSTDAAFAPGETKQLTSPYMLLAPTEAFEPGTYHWRWRPNGTEEWSQVRSFTVPEGVPVVPFPDIDALVKRIGTSRPRVLVTAAQLDDVRQRARATFGGNWPDTVQRNAERARDKELLPEPEFLPKDDPEKRRQLYQKTFQTTRPFFREMANLAQGYLLTGNPLSGQEAKRRLLHICSWDPRGSTCLGHNDEPATEVIRYCPTVYDRVHDLLTEGERKRCLDCLTIRMNEMRDRWRRRPFEKHPYESHNMGYYLPDALEASLALVGEAPVEEVLRYTMMQLWSPFYPPYGGTDGGWNEGPNYWGWSTAVFARTYNLVERTTGVPIHLRSHVRNMWRYKLYGNPPYFKMSPFGDGQEGPSGGGHTMAMLAAMYENPYAKWYAEQKNGTLGGMDRLLFDVDSVTAKAPFDLPQGHAFYDVGLACMHTVLPDPTSNVAVLMRSCPFGSISHAFADQNTFVLDAYGEPLIIASGYYQLYGHPHHAEWTWTTQASNSVLVNGEGQSKRDWNAKGHLKTFHTTAAGDYAVGDAEQAYKERLDRFDRHLVFLRPVHTGGEPIIVIRDDLSAPEPSTYQFLLHAVNEMQVDKAAQRVTIAKGDARCQVEYLAPDGLEFDQHDQFTKPPIRGGANQWHLTASTSQPSKTAASLIAVQPYRSGNRERVLATEVRSGDGCVGVSLTGDGRTVTVLFRTDPEAATVRLGDIETDAQVASVCIADGRPRSGVVFGGTVLRHEDVLLLQCPAPGATSASLLHGEECVVSSDADDPVQIALYPGEDDTATPLVVTPAPEQELQSSRTLQFSSPAAWRPWVRRVGGPAPATLGRLTVNDEAVERFTTERHDWVQRLIARSPLVGPTGHYGVQATVGNSGEGELPVVLSAGGDSVRRVLAPKQQGVSIVLPTANLGGGREVSVMADEALGGRLTLGAVEATRLYDTDLLPHGSFEEVADGGPVGWRAATITRNAQCALSSADGGRNGSKCLKVTCTDATGGDFGAMLTWPGIAPSEVDRTFCMSCWVRTDADSVAGLQVASSTWKWYANTERLRDAKDWTQTSQEFVLPAGENLTHVRLHMNAKKTGAELFVDDVSLVELSPQRETAQGGNEAVTEPQHQVICKEPGRYLGWPTIAQKQDGELLVVFSGDRDEHVCPYGKTQLIRSRDSGRTWTEPETINDTILDDRDAGILVCRSGTIVVSWFTSLAFEQYDCRKMYGDAMVDGWQPYIAKITDEDRKELLAHWIRRSTDGGKTWLPAQKVYGTAPHGPIQLDDGRLMFLGTGSIDGKRVIAAEESTDDGATWEIVGRVSFPDDVEGYWGEPHLAQTTEGTLVAHFRHERGGATGHYLWQSESVDFGRTWTLAHKLPLWGFPPHLLRLRDGRLLTTYGYRRKPYGQRACLSTDGGETWNLDNEIILRDDGLNGDLGYPASVQLDDDAILTVYYQIDEAGKKTCLMTTRWTLP